MSFDNFQKGLTKETDKFGYITQLLGYLHGSKDDPVVKDKDSASFLVMDKQHGHLHLDTHVKNPEINFEEAFEQRKAEVNSPDMPPRSFEPIPDGYKHSKTKEFVPNGNMKLDTYCSYCEQKFNCHDNIRVFLFSNGPKFFTKILEGKEPKVYEIKEDHNQKEATP